MQYLKNINAEFFFWRKFSIPGQRSNLLRLSFLNTKYTRLIDIFIRLHHFDLTIYKLKENN